MAVNYPVVTEIACKTWCINEFGMDCCFLLEGTEAALLIDTGTCIFRLDELVKYLTKKPLVVALTHGHPDHAGGISLFDMVLVHAADEEAARTITPEVRRDYAKMMLEKAGGVFEADLSEMPESGHLPRFVHVREGDIIDLGDRTVEIYETPGHTAGSISFLDRKERLIFTGDACNPHTLLTTGGTMTVSDLLSTAEKIESLRPYYDRNYNGHVGYAGYINAFSMPESINRDCIKLCRGLLDGTIQGEYMPEDGILGSCMAAENGSIVLQYKEEQVK